MFNFIGNRWTGAGFVQLRASWKNPMAMESDDDNSGRTTPMFWPHTAYYFLLAIH